MTPREYLNQAYRLEQRIKIHREEIENLRSLSESVSSPGFEEKFNPNRSRSAPFENLLLKVMEMEDEEMEMLERLLCLKQEIVQVIEALESKDERLILRYRYLRNMTWARIADEIFADERTVRRWHDRALTHVVLPDNPTVIN